MTEINNVSESNEKSEFYENKIQRLTNELEIQNQKRNQEMEELFEEMELENNNLKKDLMQTKEELEEEKDKNNNIKNSIYNFNYYQTNVNNFSNEKPNNIELITKNNNDENFYNPSSLFCDNIKLIKEQHAKKLSELNKENEKKFKNFEKDKNILEKNIKSMINSIKNNNLYDDNLYNNQYNDIIDEINSYNNKINSLINENYSNKKYIILLQEKLEYAKEEIIFLKERIIQEKKNILEKINEICYMNKLTHVNFSTEIINEINSKRKNYFNEQFFMPLDNLHQLLLESKDNEKDLKNKINKLQKDLDELNYKYEQVNEQKNNLLKNASDYIVDKENEKLMILN